MKTISLVCATLLLAGCGGGGGGSTTSQPDPGPGTLGQAVQDTAVVIVAQGTAVPIAAELVIEPPVVAIAAGSFQWPGVARTVNVPAFQMGKYEITVGQWRQFVNAKGFRSQNPTCWELVNTPDRIASSSTKNWDAPGFAQNDSQPVTCVSDVDAKAYMTWLQTMTGKTYRLPSEAEWQYAFLAGQSTAWPGGASQICRYGNVRDSAGIIVPNPDGNFACSDGAAWTSVVGMYEANRFGLYDMLGNVSEIFDDCEHSSYAEAPLDGSVWSSVCINTFGKSRRGATYVTYPVSGTDAGHYGSGNHSVTDGFRVVQVGPVTPVTSATRTFETDLEKARVAERLRRQAAAM